MMPSFLYDYKFLFLFIDRDMLRLRAILPPQCLRLTMASCLMINDALARGRSFLSSSFFFVPSMTMRREFIYRAQKRGLFFSSLFFFFFSIIAFSPSLLLLLSRRKKMRAVVQVMQCRAHAKGTVHAVQRSVLRPGLLFFRKG